MRTVPELIKKLASLDSIGCQDVAAIEYGNVSPLDNASQSVSIAMTVAHDPSHFWSQGHKDWYENEDEHRQGFNETDLGEDISAEDWFTDPMNVDLEVDTVADTCKLYINYVSIYTQDRELLFSGSLDDFLNFKLPAQFE